MPQYLYLIPARGGSKGIPGKNIRPLCGTPLIGHTIRQALEVARQEDVVVTTDDEAIADTARAAGASVPFMRPACLATDTASSRDAILHALDWMESHGRHYDAVVLLQPTSPLRLADDISRCITAFEQARRDGLDPEMAVTVCEARTNPYYSAFETDPDGFLHISKGDGHYTRRQDAPKVWEFNGAVYVIDARALRREQISRLRRTIPVEMPSSRSIDLDTPSDWDRAEEAMRRLKMS
ncbi:MAG: acylneuraminate cytidylyltransferase family protein [Muribaculaceae bacterium]|nr:acylneuraminate cytidylyltransferase family protein [Muribaculaceae bacterium]MDE7081138.1 acylneuraminate cytidylyltransferase family protein [Muribaculaceae bacterium]